MFGFEDVKEWDETQTYGAHMVASHQISPSLAPAVAPMQSPLLLASSTAHSIVVSLPSSSSSARPLLLASSSAWPASTPCLLLHMAYYCPALWRRPCPAPAPALYLTTPFRTTQFNPHLPLDLVESDEPASQGNMLTQVNLVPLNPPSKHGPFGQWRSVEATKAGAALQQATIQLC